LFSRMAGLPESRGYFRFGRDVICFGNYSGRQVSNSPEGELHDAGEDVRTLDGKVCLQFDPAEVIENLRNEIYAAEKGKSRNSVVARLYYFVRPLLPVPVRKHLQKFHLRGWDKVDFPRWPVDCSVESLFEEMMLLCLRASGAEKIPFIWFWPEGSSGCAIMTHDVESQFGKDLCSNLMDVDESYGIKSSFQLIPEERYDVTDSFLESFRRRQFEVVVHDLNHDGHLYDDHEQFLERAAKINAYRMKFGAEGFRAGILYRNQKWFNALSFSYDMSVPNVAHLDPQHGGCCTVMPYFVGDLLEIPVTTVQDYTLFNILNDYSLNIWDRQIESILKKHGMMSFIIHPDYIQKDHELATYRALLDRLAALRSDKGVWIALPGEVNRWWRDRAKMSLIDRGHGWEIEGEGRERARIAYASEENGRVVFKLEEPAAPGAIGVEKRGAAASH
jgi:hypothetical protein